MLSKIILGICVILISSVSMASWLGEGVMFSMDDVPNDQQSVAHTEAPLFSAADDFKDPFLRTRKENDIGDSAQPYQGAGGVWGMKPLLPSEMDISLLQSQSDSEDEDPQEGIPRETRADDGPVAPQTAPLPRRNALSTKAENFFKDLHSQKKPFSYRRRPKGTI